MKSLEVGCDALFNAPYRMRKWVHREVRRTHKLEHLELSRRDGE